MTSSIEMTEDAVRRGEEAVRADDGSSPTDDNVTPLPLRQIVCVLAIQLNEALQINVLYPFLVFAVEQMRWALRLMSASAGKSVWQSG